MFYPPTLRLSSRPAGVTQTVEAVRAITGGDATALADVAASVTGSSLTAQSDDELYGAAGPSGDDQLDPARPQQQPLHADFGRAAGDAAALAPPPEAALGGHGKSSGRVLSKMERAHIISGAVHCLVGSMAAARRLSVMGPSDVVRAGAAEERSSIIAFHRTLRLRHHSLFRKPESPAAAASRRQSPATCP